MDRVSVAGIPVRHGTWTWVALRLGLGVSALGVAFVDGLGFFLAPGQAVVWALSSASPAEALDSRWGTFLGLVFYAALAFVSVIMRAGEEAPTLPELADERAARSGSPVVPGFTPGTTWAEEPPRCPDPISSSPVPSN